MVENIRINKGDASISYDLLDDEKATSVYKKIRTLTEDLSYCNDYADFHDFVKKLKSSDLYKIVEISLWTEHGFYVRIGHMPEFDEEDDSELEEIEAAG